VAKGRDVFFQYLEHHGIEYLFGNPGTTELPLVDGSNDHPSVRYVMSLHEDIAVAMAMGYARASGKVGVVNLHVAPGLAHGLGNLYNAFRAGMPLIVTAGQQHTRLVVHDPILTADLAEMARPFTKWAYEVRFAEELPTVMQRAFKEALTPPTGPVFISFPPDVLLGPAPSDAPVGASTIGTAIADEDTVIRATSLLASAKSPMIVAGDGVGLACAWKEVAEIAEAIGAPVYTEQYATLWDFPSDHPHFSGPMPNQAVGMRQRFEGVDVALLAGFTAQAPVARFDDKGSLIPASVRIVAAHDRPWEIGKNQPVEAGLPGSIQRNLAALASALRSAARQDGAAGRSEKIRAASAKRRQQWRDQADAARRSGKLDAAFAAAELAAVFPANGVFVDEAISNREAFVNQVAFADPKAYFAGKGLSLGYSVGAAIGLRLGQPERPVITVVGDGSLLYYPQALWSVASLKLPIVTIVLNNASYRVLKLIVGRMGGPWNDAKAALPGLDFESPRVDFAAMARSMGLEGERVATTGELRPTLERALAAKRPYVVDVLLDQPGEDAA
jgi:benzoylformate decarboxylase